MTPNLDYAVIVLSNRAAELAADIGAVRMHFDILTQDEMANLIRNKGLMMTSCLQAMSVLMAMPSAVIGTPDTLVGHAVPGGEAAS